MRVGGGSDGIGYASAWAKAMMHTVFFLKSAPGAFEIEIKHCHFTLQLAPPFDV